MKATSRLTQALFICVAISRTMAQGTPKNVYVSPDATPSPPYESWASGFNDIQSAIDYAAEGDTLLVASGVYAIIAQIDVNKGVMLIGVDGPSATTVTRASGNIRIFSITHDDALVAGFTIANGYRPTDSAHGANISISAGTVSNCVVTGGNCNRGSIVYMTGGRFTSGAITNNNETGNQTRGTGGAYLNGGNAIIEHSTIVDNNPGTVGDSLALKLNGAVTARHLRIADNRVSSAVYIRAAVTITGTGTLLQNCLIVDNPARGIGMTGDGRIEHCTIANNSVFGNIGNGIYMSAGTMANTIAYYNGNALYPSLASDVVLDGGSVSNSCCGNFVPGSGNTQSPPLFKDLDNHDYTLLPGSPCIDAGANLTAVTSDLAGNPRPVDGNGDNIPAHDMGAFEAEALNIGAWRCGFGTPAHEVVGSLTAVLTPYVAGTSMTVTYASWDFGDGTTLSRNDLAPVIRTFAPGLYTISLTVSNAIGESATTTIQNYIGVAPETSYAAGDGAHIVPFDTWAKAATNIHDAINILIHTNSELRTVTVSNGTFNITEQILLNRPFRLQSVTGPEFTTIRRSSGSTRVMYIDHADAQVNGFTIANGGNMSAQGIGLLMTGGTASNCWVTENLSNRGSSVWMSGGRMTHSRIFSNVENGNVGVGCGGAQLSGDAILEWTTLEDNRPNHIPNSVMALTLGGTSTARHCRIINQKGRSLTQVSHVVLINSAGALLQNCLIANNPGRGIHMTANATVENCTITRNTIYGDEHNGLYMSAGTVRNSIIWDNGSDNANNTTVDDGTFIFSNTNPSQNGDGNQNTDPAFIDSDGEDYRLDITSLMINAGTNQLWMETAVDLDGEPRVIGNRVDLGAYEAPLPDPDSLSCNFAAPVTEGINTLEVEFTSIVVGSNTNIAFYDWSFGDGNSQSGGGLAVVAHTYTKPGYYNVTLAVRNTDGLTAVWTNATFIYIAPLTAYVATNGLHQAPFETWKKASTNIQEAINVARVQGEQSTLVLVTNGLYQVSSQIELLKGITVRSINGRDHTIVWRSAGSQRIFWLNHANAVIDGLTLGNGAQSGLLLDAGTVLNSKITKSYGNRTAGAMIMKSGLVSNSIFNASWDVGVYGGCGVLMYDGLMIACTIEGNHSGIATDAIGGLRLAGGEVWNTIIRSNVYGTGASGTAGGMSIGGKAAIYNSLIAYNDGLGVLQGGGTIINCTVVRNSLVGLNQTSGSVSNSIIYFNNNGGDNLTGNGTHYHASCAPELSQGPEGNLNDNPLFYEAGSGYGTGAIPGDYHLKSLSPCIDAATYLSWMETTTDLGGEPRMQNKGPDMGAYESFRPPRGSILLLR